MILTCPACGTSYTVKDGAIPSQGRNVRCAACKHSWHQDGEADPSLAAEPAVTELGAETQSTIEGSPPPVSEATGDEFGGNPDLLPDPPLAAEQADVVFPGDAGESVEEVLAGRAEMTPASEPMDVPAASEDFPAWNEAGYGGRDEPAPRRKGLVVILLLVLLIALVAAAAWFLAPREWMARAGLVAASSDSPLKLMVTSQDRQKLASGNDLVSLSGRVINPTDATQPVPALQADLRDNGGKLVYTWTIAPPTARLAPRASQSFNAAELGVPANATSLTLRWAS